MLERILEPKYVHRVKKFDLEIASSEAHLHSRQARQSHCSSIAHRVPALLKDGLSADVTADSIRVEGDKISDYANGDHLVDEQENIGEDVEIEHNIRAFPQTELVVQQFVVKQLCGFRIFDGKWNRMNSEQSEGASNDVQRSEGSCVGAMSSPKHYNRFLTLPVEMFRSIISSLSHTDLGDLATSLPKDSAEWRRIAEEEIRNRLLKLPDVEFLQIVTTRALPNNSFWQRIMKAEIERRLSNAADMSHCEFQAFADLFVKGRPESSELGSNLISSEFDSKIKVQLEEEARRRISRIQEALSEFEGTAAERHVNTFVRTVAQMGVVFGPEDAPGPNDEANDLFCKVLRKNGAVYMLRKLLFALSVHGGILADHGVLENLNATLEDLVSEGKIYYEKRMSTALPDHASADEVSAAVLWFIS